MKYRKGFVTNSSSSSYICDICGNEASGYDISLSDYDMFQCKNGHTFCEEHATKKIDMYSDEFLLSVLNANLAYYKNMKPTKYWTQKTKDKVIKDAMKEIEDFINGNIDELDKDDFICEARYEMPPEYCPVCNFEHFRDSDLLLFILKHYNINNGEVQADVKNTFKSYAEFKNYIRK